MNKQKKLLKAMGQSTRIGKIEARPSVGLTEEFLTMLTDLRTTKGKQIKRSKLVAGKAQ